MLTVYRKREHGYEEYVIVPEHIVVIRGLTIDEFNKIHDDLRVSIDTFDGTKVADDILRKKQESLDEMVAVKIAPVVEPVEPIN